jgi:transcriptional regulator with XRE-family HTH domain
MSTKDTKDKPKSHKDKAKSPKDKPKKQAKRQVFVAPGPVSGQSAPPTPVQAPAPDPTPDPDPDDTAEAVDLGERLSRNLRALRKARGLSLEALSGSSGVSRAALSQIETGKTNPSIGAVWKIATALGVPFGDLIGEDRRGIEVLRRAHAPRLRSADGATESRALLRAGALPTVEAYALTLAPGARHPAEAHAPGTRELLVVLEGHVRLHVGGRTYELATGDSVAFTADVPHVYENPGHEPAQVHDVLVYGR